MLCLSSWLPFSPCVWSQPVAVNKHCCLVRLWGCFHPWGRCSDYTDSRTRQAGDSLQVAASVLFSEVLVLEGAPLVEQGWRRGTRLWALRVVARAPKPVCRTCWLGMPPTVSGNWRVPSARGRPPGTCLELRLAHSGYGKEAGLGSKATVKWMPSGTFHVELLRSPRQCP